MKAAVAVLGIAVCLTSSAFQWPGTVRKTPEKAPVLTPQQELATIVPGVVRDGANAAPHLQRSPDRPCE